jgi:hypothetical protein
MSVQHFIGKHWLVRSSRGMIPALRFKHHCMSLTQANTARVHGLDTLRALAVALVVLHHYMVFVSDSAPFGWVGEIGWAGVDLFFALSG